tara:strand:- start:409 stop:1131 length:723 start_codon:yes stop_codon:yes gene_type:complete
MKIRKIIPIASLKTFTLAYSAVIGSFLTVSLAAGIWSMIDPCISEILGRFPTPVAGLLGATLAVIGGFLVSAWRHEQEKKETVENLAHILAHEVTIYTKASIEFVKNSLKYIKDSNQKIDTDASKEIVKIHKEFYLSDINKTYRKEISIFDETTLIYVIRYFNFINRMNNFFDADEIKAINRLKLDSGHYAEFIKGIVTGYHPLIDQLSNIHPPIASMRNEIKIDDDLKELLEVKYRLAD